MDSPEKQLALVVASTCDSPDIQGSTGTLFNFLQGAKVSTGKEVKPRKPATRSKLTAPEGSKSLTFTPLAVPTGDDDAKHVASQSVDAEVDAWLGENLPDIFDHETATQDEASPKGGPVPRPFPSMADLFGPDGGDGSHPSEGACEETAGASNEKKDLDQVQGDAVAAQSSRAHKRKRKADSSEKRKRPKKSKAEAEPEAEQLKAEPEAGHLQVEPGAEQLHGPEAEQLQIEPPRKEKGQKLRKKGKAKAKLLHAEPPRKKKAKKAWENKDEVEAKQPLADPGDEAKAVLDLIPSFQSTPMCNKCRKHVDPLRMRIVG